MIFDFIIAIVVLLAFRAGYKKGIIYMVFYLLGISLGMLAALKLNVISGEYILSIVQVPPQWLSIVSLLVNFVVVFFASQFIATSLTGFLKTIRLNIFNRLGGGLIGGLLAFSILSVVIWYISGFKLISESLEDNSAVYPYAIAFAPEFIKIGGSFLPIFKDLWAQVNGLFDDFTTKLPTNTQ